MVALLGDPLKATDALHREGAPHQRRVSSFLPARRPAHRPLRYRTRKRSVYLADRRCDLVVATLFARRRPSRPATLSPGGPPRIWPQKTQGRVELNTLVFRTRRDLIKADINGGEIFEQNGGGGARFRAAEGAVPASPPNPRNFPDRAPDIDTISGSSFCG